MSDAQHTIEFLATKARGKEEEVVALKRLINGLCIDANIPLRYPNIAELAEAADGTIRRDQFYGQTLTSAARSYLEIRRGRGAASVNEIYKAIRDGGYKFDTKDEDNAKNALRTILRKNSAIFHRLPTGDYGLLSWYPNAKAGKFTDEDGDVEETEQRSDRAKTTTKVGHTPNRNNVGNADLRATIFKLADVGTFTASAVEQAVAEKFPGRQAREGAVSILINKLKKKGLLRVVTERTGSTPATYGKS